MNRIKKVSILLVLSTLPILFGYPYFQMAHAKEDLDQVTTDFFCTCGCNMLLSVCETQMTCDVAKDMKKQIRGMIEQGMDREGIKESMIGLYGATVLAAPPMKGFTLAMWWYPVILGGLGVLAITLISRRKSNVNWRIDPDEVIALNEEELLKQIDVQQSSESTAVAQKYDDILRRKLKPQTDVKPPQTDAKPTEYKAVKKNYDATLKKKMKESKN